jgi:hypothetical protein
LSRTPREARVSAGVFLASAALLAFEVLLLRLFAIEQFHHFAYMAIGMALLGSGAGGTALVLARRHVEGRVQPLLVAAAAGLVIALMAAVPLAHAAALDAAQIVFDPAQWWSLAGVYAALALPFLCGAVLIALALIDAGPAVGRVYGANMLGAGAGALLALALLALTPPARAVAAPALVAAGAAAWLVPDVRAGAAASVALIVVLGLAAGAVLARPPWSLRVSPFKGLTQIEAFPDAERIAERWSPVGWTVAVRAPAFRHAPGLSLAYDGALPPQTALFVDGETAGAATAWAGDAAATAFLGSLIGAAPYAVRPAARVLVLGAGDGLDVAVALAHGAARVTAVELNGSLAALADSLAGPRPSEWRDARVEAVTGGARTFVAGTRARFDLIVLPLAGGFHATAAGMHGSGEDYLNTVEAYTDYLRALAPGGMLAVTRWVRTPPRDNVKVILTAAAALRRAGVADVGGSLAFVRGWAAATLLVRPGGFGTAELDALGRFAGERWFDLDWPVRAGDAGPFNLLERPVFTAAAAAAAAGGTRPDAFAAAYPFDVRPATDDRPWFGRFVRTRALPAMLRSPPGDWLPFAEWGHLALLATLAQSTVLAAVLLLLPVAVARIGARARQPGRARPPGAAPPATGASLRLTGYFAAIGFAYLFVEIAAIQRLTLVLGHPIYAAAAVLAAFLAASGLGSLWSDRLAPDRTSTACAAAAGLALVATLAFGAAGLVLPLPAAVRTGLAMAVLAPLALSMGLPFPLGLRRLAGSPGGLAWAWAINGFASVAAASLAVLLAMEAGTRALIAAGALLYAGAAWVARAGSGA